MMRPVPATIVLLLALGGCHAAEPERDILRIGLAQMPISADPRYATDAASARVQEFIHCGLVRLDASFNATPDLAESWQHPDPLTWQFRLKQGVLFSDGSRVKASDAAATFKAILNPERASPLRASFAAIERIEVEDEQNLTLHLFRPDASLLSRLNIGILPASLAAQPHHANSTTGCGSFRLASWSEQGITLEPSNSPERGQRIRFSAVKDPVTRVLKLSRGEIDFVQNDLPPHLLPYLEDQQQLTMRTRSSTTFSYLGLNLQDEIVGDVRVRRALALALDRSKLKDALFAGLPVLAETVLTESHWASAELPAPTFDPVEAGRLLDEAGFPRNEAGTRFSLNYRTSTDPTRLRLATAIAAMWERVGIKMTIESLEWGGFYARIKRGDFQVYSLSWVGITDPDIYRQILHSDMWPPKGANRGRYSSPEVDRWLDQAAASESLADRQALYSRVQQRMLEDMVYIPLWYEPVVAVSGPRIEGFEPMPDGNLRGLMAVRFKPERD